MKFRVLSLLLLTTWGVVSQNFINVDNLWSSSSVFQTYKDHALVGHVIKTLHVLFVGECVEKCQNTLECFSYNYFHNVSTGGICELNRSNKNQSETSYIRLHGYQYGEPEVSMTTKAEPAFDTSIQSIYLTCEIKASNHDHKGPCCEVGY